METQTLRTDLPMWLVGGGRVGGVVERVRWKCYYHRYIANGNLLCDSGNSNGAL